MVKEWGSKKLQRVSYFRNAIRVNRLLGRLSISQLDGDPPTLRSLILAKTNSHPATLVVLDSTNRFKSFALPPKAISKPADERSAAPAHEHMRTCPQSICKSLPKILPKIQHAYFSTNSDNIAFTKTCLTSEVLDLEIHTRLFTGAR